MDNILISLFFSLTGFGLLGMLFGIVTVCLSLRIPEAPDYAHGYIGRVMVILVGIVNTILNILPVSIGLIGVYVEESTKLLLGFSIIFYIFAIPNACALGWFAIRIGSGNNSTGKIARAFFLILIFIYLVEGVLMSHAMCLKTMTGMMKPDEQPVEVE